MRVWTHQGTDLTFYSLSYFELVLVDEKNREFKGKAYVGHTDLISSPAITLFFFLLMYITKTTLIHC